MLEPGDFFCTTDNGTILSRGIRWFSKFRASDDQAFYSHAGFMVNGSGRTFEALPNGYRFSNINEYSGKPLLVGRHVGMTHQQFSKAFWKIREKYIGRKYPYFRLLVHMLPAMSKYVHFGKPVCSELCFYLGHLAGLKDMAQYWGKTPDNLADAIHRWDVFDVIYEWPPKAEHLTPKT